MRLARQLIIQPLEDSNIPMAAWLALPELRAPAALFIFCRSHSRLVDANKIDRQWPSSSGTLQDDVDRPSVNAKERRLFDMMPRIRPVGRHRVIERPL
jgi:hypothetical protein